MLLLLMLLSTTACRLILGSPVLGGKVRWLQLFPLSPIGKKMRRKLGVGGAGYLLLKGVEEDPGGVLKEEGGVGQQERLLVRARESKRGALC